VLYFQDEGPKLSSIDERYESPLDLWAALRAADARALTFAHHSAGGPIATDWRIPPDPELEPVTEIVSVHGVSEALDADAVIYNPLRGNFARDALDRGYRLGFVGSGDSHDGHPGLAHLGGPTGGVAAILAEDCTREAVLDALRQRHVYATSGPRILLRAALNGKRMGSLMAAPADGKASLILIASATAPLEHVDVIQSGAPVSRFQVPGEWDVSTTIELEGLAKGDYVYVRVLQQDGGQAWSSPFFLE
jgi:hypothetical protein